MSGQLRKLSPLFVFTLVFFFSINAVQAQVVEEDIRNSGQQLQKAGNELQFPPFKSIVSPNISFWTPISGDDSEVYGISFKYGVKYMFRVSDRVLMELGISYSSLRVSENYINDIITDIYGGEVTDLKESSGGSLNQFFGGIRVLLASEGPNLPYLRIGASNYNRGDITASYSGQGSNYTYEGDLRIHTKESDRSIYVGFGTMVLSGNKKVAFDFQVNANLLLLREDKPIWFEPVIALNILL